MIEFIGALFAVGFFGLLVQRSILGALLSLQVMTTAMILALVILAGAGHPEGSGIVSAMVGRARDAGLVFMVVFQIQSIAALAFATRLHYLKVSSGVADLNTMRN